VREAGIPYSTVTYTAAPGRQEHPFQQSGEVLSNHDINLICVNADQVSRFIHDIGPDFLAHRYSIGLWWGEVARFPGELHNAFEVMNEIWVGSDFARRAISAETDKPVLTVPLGLSFRTSKTHLEQSSAFPTTSCSSFRSISSVSGRTLWASSKRSNGPFRTPWGRRS
jgi:hypothetical protein